MLRKIAVLGGGNGAHAMAADLTLKVLEVNMCEAPEFKQSFSTIDATIKLASVINQTDYYKEGRLLEELGIADLSQEELAEVLQEGF